MLPFRRVIVIDLITHPAVAGERSRPSIAHPACDGIGTIDALRPSPEAGDAESVEDLFIRDERDTLDQGLRDQEPVEWILVGDLKPTSEDGMGDRDRQGSETLDPDDHREILRQDRGIGEFSETVFGDDLHR